MKIASKVFLEFFLILGNLEILKNLGGIEVYGYFRRCPFSKIRKIRKKIISNY
jgi:hypothetical protein